MITFVTTPTRIWLEEQAAKCSCRFLVASPYIGDYLVKVARSLPGAVKRILVTRTDLRDFAKGASDIDAVCETARLGAKVLSLPKLHAKVYVIDKSAALVTSANATHSGMGRNWECGVAIDDEAEVCRLANLVVLGFGSTECPQPWSLSELERLRQPVKALRDALPPSRPVFTTGLEEHPSIALAEDQWHLLDAGLAGWTRLTLEGVRLQKADQFDIHEIYRTCLPIVAKRFPANRFPREKLRQQLQRLRDLGIIEFLGEGYYRRTIQVKE